MARRRAGELRLTGGLVCGVQPWCPWAGDVPGHLGRVGGDQRM